MLLAVLAEKCTHIDPDLHRRSASEWCKAIRVLEIAIAASKNIWQPEPKATVVVDEEDR